MPSVMPLALELVTAPWELANKNPALPFAPDRSTAGVYQPLTPAGFSPLEIARGIPEGGLPPVQVPFAPDRATSGLYRPMFFTTPGTSMIEDVPLVGGVIPDPLPFAPDFATPGTYAPRTAAGRNPVFGRGAPQGSWSKSDASLVNDVTVLPNLAPIVIHQNQPGNLNANGALVLFNVEGGTLAIRVTPFQSWDGQVVFEATVDGVNFDPIICLNQRNGASELYANAGGLWIVKTGGLTAFRARHVAGSHGVVNVGGRWERIVSKGN